MVDELARRVEHEARRGRGQCGADNVVELAAFLEQAAALEQEFERPDAQRGALVAGAVVEPVDDLLDVVAELHAARPGPLLQHLPERLLEPEAALPAAPFEDPELEGEQRYGV